jgi:hypothetical protein
MWRIDVLTVVLGLSATLLICTTAACGDSGDDSGNPGTCFASCVGLECGDNGCGGLCGVCAGQQSCVSGECVGPGGSTIRDDGSNLPWEDGHPVGKSYELPAVDEPMADSDGDGLADGQDNCPWTSNPLQENFDGDEGGDACDPDDDNDADPDDSDCAALDPFVNKYMPEVCDGVDNNCNGVVDDPDLEGCIPHWVDEDGDGFGKGDPVTCLCPNGAPGFALQGGDCNDQELTQNPLATEICDDLDDDCDQTPDNECDVDGDGYCDSQKVVVGFPAVCPLGPGDCDDYEAAINPGQEEIPADSIDNDCDGLMDAGFECTGPCIGHTKEAFMCALEMCMGSFPIYAEFHSPTGDEISPAWDAVSHFGSQYNDLAPMAGESYGLLATGPALGTVHNSDLLGGVNVNDPFSKDDYTTFDNVEFKATITAPAGVTGFSIDYVFFSEEYHDWVCTSFNDKFYIFLTAPQTTGNVKEIINYTACADPNAYHDFIDEDGQKHCYVAINTAFSESCPNPATDISGTGFECSLQSCEQTQCECGSKDPVHGSSTGWLVTVWPIEPDETFELVFHIHDTSDGIYDSEVILDNFQWLTVPITSGTLTKD